jgi:hypothetical protein
MPEGAKDDTFHRQNREAGHNYAADELPHGLEIGKGRRSYLVLSLPVALRFAHF